MDCKETDEYISAVVDKERLEQQQQRAVSEHIERCVGCRNEYEMEVITKSVVQKHLRMIPTPPQLLNCILRRIRRAESIQTLNHMLKQPRDLFLYPVPRAVVVVAALVVAIIVGVVYFQSRNENYPVDTGRRDMILEAVNQYRSYAAGAVGLQVKSSDVTEIRKFFQGRVDFEVVVPTLRGWSLLGGVFTKCNGAGIAHLVYSKDDLIILLCQSNVNDVIRNARFDLPVEAKTAIAKGGWYTAKPHEDCIVAVWRENHVVCSAVAGIDKTELMELLTLR